MSHVDTPDFDALPVPPCELGESPLWHPDEQALYWVDIPGHALHRFEPSCGRHDRWEQPSEPACLAPMLGGGLLMARRDGLWHVQPQAGAPMAAPERLAPPPYDPASERFNDGKADAWGRFWVGTIYEPRDREAASLYCWERGQLTRIEGGATVANGLAFSPDARWMYWSDTKSHRIDRFAISPVDGSAARREPWRQFEHRPVGAPLEAYGGRPDGATVDAEGCYWVAMFEGQQLLRLSPKGEVLRRVRLPVRCPTMPCLGGADLRTLFVTTARHNRPAAELAAQPLAGRVLSLRVDVPGLPAHFAQR
ncbi:SMP-30/gluconolactonase/LRE family protein [Ideonella livida]|uniref:SMP-30/gluconolactonase/LRE family protein n=1 Tax=Ideonella livida TaxID=2707176 RepID=A0A7C9PFY6_9BURK|nr:SMP-30/gluconolactonase/LRE family protein [Ideonella livida]NDY90933.1 SMP-30/gluconolactonase/LRE family protein [Ideonella livida]